MAADAQKINEYFDKALGIWDKVRPIQKVAKDIRNNVQKYFQGSQSGLVKQADKDLLVCVRLGLSFREYTGQFAAPGARWQEATYFLSIYTNASVGQKSANVQALIKLRELEAFLSDLVTMADSSKTITSAVFMFVTVPSSLKGAADKLSSVTTAANFAARDKANRDFDATVKDVNRILPSVRQAIQLVQRM